MPDLPLTERPRGGGGDDAATTIAGTGQGGDEAASSPLRDVLFDLTGLVRATNLGGASGDVSATPPAVRVCQIPARRRRRRPNGGEDDNPDDEHVDLFVLVALSPRGTACAAQLATVFGGDGAAHYEYADPTMVWRSSSSPLAPSPPPPALSGGGEDGGVGERVDDERGPGYDPIVLWPGYDRPEGEGEGVEDAGPETVACLSVLPRGGGGRVGGGEGERGGDGDCVIVLGTSRGRVLAIELTVGVDADANGGDLAGTDKSAAAASAHGCRLRAIAESHRNAPAFEPLLPVAPPVPPLSPGVAAGGQDDSSAPSSGDGDGDVSARDRPTQQLPRPAHVPVEEGDDYRIHGPVVAILPHYRKLPGDHDDDDDDDSFERDWCRVWITFADGSSVRLPRRSLFRSARIAAAALTPVPSVDLAWLHPPPAMAYDSGATTVVPLPVHHPSPFEPLVGGGVTSGSSFGSDEEDGGFHVVHPDEYHDAVAFGSNGDFDNGGSALGPPSLTFLTGSRIAPPRPAPAAGDDKAADGVGSWANTAAGIATEDPGSIAGGGAGGTTSVTGYHVRERVAGGTRSLVRGVWGYVYGGAAEPTTEEGANVGVEASDAAIADDAPSDGEATARGEPATKHASGQRPPPPSSSTWTTVRSSRAALLPRRSLLDPPRRITSAVASPCGTYLALSDALGRVQLVDLTSDSVVRMWKGVREGTCAWAEEEEEEAEVRTDDGKGGGKTRHLYLVIHAGVRGVAEAYRVRHGPRAGSWALEGGGGSGGIVSGWAVEEGGPCHGGGGGPPPPPLARCFLVRSSGDGSVALESLRIADGTATTTAAAQSGKKVPAVAPSSGASEPRKAKQVVTATAAGRASVAPSDAVAGSGGADLHLQLLRQMLSPDAAGGVGGSTSPSAAYDAFSRIGSLADLASALDLMAKSEALEGTSAGGGRGDFHSKCVAYVEERTVEVLSDGAADEGDDAIRSVQEKIEYHSRLIAAYGVLRKFETSSNVPDGNEDEDNSASPGGGNGSNPWAAEAASWLETHEAVAGRGSLDELLPPGAGAPPAPLTFPRFVQCLDPKLGTVDSVARSGDDDDDAPPKRGLYLCDSTKDRRSVLVHLFRPLTADVFAFRVSGDMFAKLGVAEDRGAMQRYFGEWFMSLPVSSASSLSISSRSFRPPVRWLQETVGALIEDELRGSEGAVAPGVLDGEAKAKRNDDDFDPRDAEDFAYLRDLHAFCSDAEDLPRAFLLAAACREAVSAETAKREERTYGRVSEKDSVEPWDQLLRNLRVCLLARLRLWGTPLGQFPVTVSHVASGQAFSVYEWVARDELSISHSQDEITALEDTCRMCRQAFDPSSPVGDGAERVRTLQRVCRVGGGKGERAARFFMADNDQPGPLLLYLGGFNHPVRLAAHRAMLLGAKWSEQPESIHILKDSVSALRALEADGGRYRSLAAAVRLELWQVCVRPVYRAVFFGFDDVPELREELLAPLCIDPGWLHELSRVALEVLALLARTASSSLPDGTGQPTGTSGPSLAVEHGGTSAEADTDLPWTNIWPNTKGDVLLDGFEARARPVERSALEAHRAIVSASQLADDFSSLVYCVPSFEEMFERHSLFSPAAVPSSCTEYQVEFLNRAVARKALLATGPIVDRFVLESIENLGRSWGVDLAQMRARFLLAMYDVGKDEMITDDLLNMGAHLLDIPLFIDGGLEIASTRLNDAVSTLRRMKSHRGIVATLDADTCKWVQDQASLSQQRKSEAGDDFDEDFEPSPLSSTHALTLRILRMCSTIEDSEGSEKAHALSIMCGSLIAALEENPVDTDEL